MRTTIPRPRRNPRWHVVTGWFLAAICVGDSARAVQAQHPLDGLTEAEYIATRDILREHGLARESSHFFVINLDEPDKQAVLRWRPGQSFQRRAFVVLRRGDEFHEAVVDLTAGNVSSSRLLEQEQPGLLLSEEWSTAQRIVHATKRWREAVRARGVEPRDVVLLPLPATQPRADAARLVNVIAFSRSGVRNYWGRPLEGLVAIVDLRARRFVELLDDGPTTLPTAPVDFDASAVPQSAPQTTAPSQAIETRDGLLRWHSWSLHFRLDPRLGLVVSNVRYADHGRERSVLYQGSLSELFVPYMDASRAWTFRSYLDAGEYGIGKLAVSLVPGLDCPVDARFFDALLADDWGEPFRIERAVAVFERDLGNVEWRHHERTGDWSAGRKRVELVVRFAASIGNYDYVFDWVFRRDGSIRIEVGSTGVAEVKAVEQRRADVPGAADELLSGHLVAENTLGVHHGHFFCYRLDVDVDGSENGFVADRLRPRPAAASDGRTSTWSLEPFTPVTEDQARFRINLENPALWRVIHARKRGPMGYPVGYILKPGPNAVSLLALDDAAQRRAGFTNHHLWVTPYARDQRFAAGAYPYQGAGGMGLPKWVRAARPIQGRDLVLWYTLGFHHVVRAEDWPVMPIVWHGFELRPFDFFESNPALQGVR